MDNTLILALVSMFLTFVSVVTGFILQLEKRKLKKLTLDVKELELNLNETKRRFVNALNVIEGYHEIEEFVAKQEGLTTTQYRKKIRVDADVKNVNFYTPSKVKEQKEKAV